MDMDSVGYVRPFSTIYVEEAIMEHSDTQRILTRFEHSKIIPITHYKDIFNRRHQDAAAQKQAQALILAQKEGALIYKGAPVCQDFGNSHFYYTSCVMNCIFDCEYCYLQGMYPSGHLVLFVNLEDIFTQVAALLAEHPVYLCISYDTDLMALENITGFVARWYDFASKHPDLTIEIRTKSGAFHLFEHLKPLDNVVFAWTISPAMIIEKYEHHTASFGVRLENIRRAADLGFRVRICLDPLIYIPDFEQVYNAMIREIFARPITLMDASVGVFRVSNDYMKRMRHMRPECALIHFPFVTEDGVYHYGAELSGRMVAHVRKCLAAYMPEEKIFTWGDQDIGG